MPRTHEQRVTDLCARVVAPDEARATEAWARLDSLTKPPRSLGRLEQLAVRCAVIQQTLRPDVDYRAIVLAAGDHGVVEEGVSPYPQDVTWQMVANFVSGGAAINQVAAAVDAELWLVDVGVAHELAGWHGVRDAKIAPGTRNMRRGPAMSRDQAARAIMVGAGLAEEAAHHGVRLLGTGEMGIGNTTAASALTAVLSGVDVASVVGPGTGLDDAGLVRKTDVIRDALAVNDVDPLDPLGVLAAVGGFEIACLVGVVLGAATVRVPVVVDGFISTAAALVAYRLAPESRAYVLASHRSAEPGHDVQLDTLGLDPLLDLEMRLGEGTGAALAFGLIDAACRMMAGMATFEEAGVSGDEPVTQ